MSKVIMDIEDVTKSFKVEVRELFSDLVCFVGDKVTSEDCKYTIACTHQEGGEGCGDYYESRILVRNNITNTEEYWEHTAHYDSWNGVDWDYGECYAVEPREVTVTRYFKK